VIENKNSLEVKNAVLERGGTWHISILLKGIGLFFIFLAIAWNVFIFVDAVGFDFGEHLTPACRTFRKIAGIEFVIAAFVAQLVIASILIWISRSWLLAILSVFPFWGLIASQICTGVS
jgi:hypothetical protein